MKQKINPKETNRAHAFEMWMKSPMPMVTLTKTFDVTHLYKASKRRNVKFNTLLCWCIGHAASKMTEFYLLPEQGTLFQYDRLAINVIVNNKEGDINSCDIPLPGLSGTDLGSRPAQALPCRDSSRSFGNSQ